MAKKKKEEASLYLGVGKKTGTNKAVAEKAIFDMEIPSSPTSAKIYNGLDVEGLTVLIKKMTDKLGGTYTMMDWNGSGMIHFGVIESEKMMNIVCSFSSFLEEYNARGRISVDVHTSDKFGYRYAITVKVPGIQAKIDFQG
jgi:hypothetical protein